MKFWKMVAVTGLSLAVLAAGCGTDSGKQKTDGTEDTWIEGIGPTNPVDRVPVYPEDDGSQYELTVTTVEETDEAKDGETVYFQSSLRYPMFEGVYGDNLNRIVAEIAEEFRAYLPEAKDNAAWDYADAMSYEYSGLRLPEAEELTVSFVWSKEQIAVLKAEYYSNSGGAHPNVCYKTYVVDMMYGTEMTPEQALSSYGVTAGDIVSYAAEKIREEHGEDLLETDEESYLETQLQFFLENRQWYLKETGLVLLANPYDIAPYAYGVIECEIPYEVLEQGLKK